MLNDLTGCVFGRVTVLSRAGRPSKSGSYWLCRCECGREAVLRSDTARAGRNRGCGCSVIARTAGLSGHPLRPVWAGMMHRCYSLKHPSFRYYGGRGIAVCERWHRLENFIADMGERPPDTSIDRIDVNGNYEPSNCRWATPLEQGRNRRKNYKLEVAGVSMTLDEAATKLNVDYSTLWSRIQRGWSLEEVATGKRRKWSRVRKGKTPQRLMPGLRRPPKPA